MIVTKGYKYRIYPTEQQKNQLNKTFGACRFVYNYFLSERIEKYKVENKTLSKIDCNNYCNRILKKEYPWLKEVDKFALTNSIFDLDTAYKNFFTRLKEKNKENGFPKYKSKKDFYYSYKTNFNGNSMKVLFNENHIQLPKLGKIKAKLHKGFNGKILFATVSKTPSDKYFVSFNVEVEHESLPNNNNSIGIDLGIKDLVITSDGEIFNNIKTLRKYEKRLSKLNRKFANKQNGSNNKNKQRIKIAKLHEKISNIY